MKAILSADINWGIGCDGKLLQRVPEDMKFFMKMTMGKVVIMGRETFESLPGKRPLKDRVNIVLSKNAGYDAQTCDKSGDKSGDKSSDKSCAQNCDHTGNSSDNAGSNTAYSERLIVCHSIAELFESLRAYSPEDIFVIGGQSIYTQLLPYCSEVYITRFEKEFEADRHFPDLDKMENWELAEESEPQYYNGMEFRFLKYVNKLIPMT